MAHPALARSLGQGIASGRAFVELDVAAVTDATEVTRILPTRPSKIPYPAADAYTYQLREALDAAHASIDPQTGRPWCLGRLSGGNVLFDADGRWYLFGLGHNVAVERESGVVDASVSFFSAPELAAGAEATPNGDYLAILLYARSLVHYVDLSGAIAQVLRGVVSAATAELAELLTWVDRRLCGVVPSQRPSVEEGVSVANRIRQLMGTVVDSDGFARYAAELLRDNGLPPPGPSAEAPLVEVRIGPDAAWVEDEEGVRHRLGKAPRASREVLRRPRGVGPVRGGLAGRARVPSVVPEPGLRGPQSPARAGAARRNRALR